MKITHAVGHCLVCIACHAVVDVLEAWDGAQTDADHRWIDADAYTCGACLGAIGATMTATAPDIAQVAA